MVHLKSKTFFKDLQLVLPDSSIVSGHVARLVVLYEDLRIEAYGFSSKPIKTLELIDKYRSIYFLRRSIVTLREFAEACRLLNDCTDFQNKKALFDRDSMIKWDEATLFFREQEDLLNLVRNDLGGHFGLPAAKYAVENIKSRIPAKLELSFGPRERVNVKFHFAGEIAATAFCRHLAGPTSRAKLNKLVSETLVPGFKHATDLMSPIVDLFILPRFQS